MLIGKSLTKQLFDQTTRNATLYQHVCRASVSNKTYIAYLILSVPQNSGQKEIKAAYLKFSKLYHPDNKETGDNDRFLQIQKAYDHLVQTKNSKDALKEEPNVEAEEDQSETEDLSHKSYMKYKEMTREYFNEKPGVFEKVDKANRKRYNFKYEEFQNPKF